MSDQNEKDDIEQLLGSAGWLRLIDRARLDWKDGYPAKIKQAIADAKAQRGDLAAAVAAVDYANDEINKLLSWPKERLARLNQPETTTSQSRGGYGAQS